MEQVPTTEEIAAEETRQRRLRRLIAVGVSIAVGAGITIAALMNSDNHDDVEPLELEPLDDETPDVDSPTETTETD